MNSKQNLKLFPEINPYSSGFLSVDETHDLYWEQSGNPDGVPIVFIHGGPGGGSSPIHRQFFDPDHYRIIVFDQRGAGRSTPLASITNNTTQHLVDDLESLRGHLKIKYWHLFGGSWGSTLALAYAAAHPARVMSMILRGIFLCEQNEVDWFLYGMRAIFPEAWEEFAGFLPEEERSDLLGGYYKRLTGGDKDLQIKAAEHWSQYEGACLRLLPKHTPITTDDQRGQALAIAKIEAHFFTHEMFTDATSLLNHIDTYRKIPSTIVQGRYDIICPIATAHRLVKNWPEANYVIVPDAGHSALEPTLRSALIEATENAKKITVKLQGTL